MTTYRTAQPISATIQLVHGDVRIEASDREDTIVDVTPSNASHDADVAAAAQTEVEYADGVLRVRGQRGRSAAFLRKPGSVRLVIQMPTGSHVKAATGLGRVTTSGRLGDCHVRSGAGDLQVADTASADLVTGLGTIIAGHVVGDVACTTGSGGVRVAHVDGSAQVKNSNGDTWLGEVGNAARVKASNGTIAIDRAHGDVKAATANGDVRIGSAERGAVDIRTALGRIEVGVAEGTAARLDLHTSFGTVVSDLEATARPRPEDSTVSVHAQTSAGDIVIRRAPSEDAGLPATG